MYIESNLYLFFQVIDILDSDHVRNSFLIPTTAQLNAPLRVIQSMFPTGIILDVGR